MLFLSTAQPMKEERGFATELRLDLFPNINLKSIRNCLENSTSPIMLTIRKISQGGKFQGTESEREALILKLLTFEPPFFDLESNMNPQFLHEAIKNHPKTKFI